MVSHWQPQVHVFHFTSIVLARIEPMDTFLSLFSWFQSCPLGTSNSTSPVLKIIDYFPKSPYSASFLLINSIIVHPDAQARKLDVTFSLRSSSHQQKTNSVNCSHISTVPFKLLTFLRCQLQKHPTGPLLLSWIHSATQVVFKQNIILKISHCILVPTGN